MTDATREALTPAEHVEVLRYKLFCQLRANASLEKCSETWREIDAALQQPEAAEPVAYRYRWKIDGEWTSWHVSDASQNPEYFSSLEEEPLYTAPPASADMREALEKIEQLNPLAIEALEVHQTQLDQDGVMVGVSRQAVDEVVAAVKALRQALSRDGTKSEGGVDWDDVRGIAPDATGDLSSEAFIRKQRDEWDKSPSDPTPPDREAPEGLPFGIIDPDYARFFTDARLACWNYGYALAMHGSFTRDLDLIAMPWTETACDAEKLIQQIEYRTEWKRLPGKECSHREHGRMVWTLTSPKFNCARFVDFSVVPTDSNATATAASVELERLREVADAAQGLLNADTYVSSVPRAEAVAQATHRLQQALGTRQMHHTEALALTSGRR